MYNQCFCMALVKYYNMDRNWLYIIKYLQCGMLKKTLIKTMYSFIFNYFLLCP